MQFELSNPSFVAEISVTHVTPAETQAFVVVQVAQRRPPVYWRCQSPQSKEERATESVSRSSKSCGHAAVGAGAGTWTSRECTIRSDRSVRLSATQCHSDKNKYFGVVQRRPEVTGIACRLSR